MSQIAKLREQIDACRAGSDDLLLPELAELARAVAADHNVAAELARAGRLDQEITAALNDVPLPEGLLDRLLAAAGENISSKEPVATPRPPSERLRARHLRWPSRRQWMLIGSSVALIAVVAVSAYQYWQTSGRAVSSAELSAAVNVWISQTESSPAAWQLVKTEPLPSNISIDPAIRRPVPIAWQQIRATGGWCNPVTAVRLSSDGAPRAILFVIRSSAEFRLPPAPTATARLELSGGWSATAWRRPGSKYLYVLVVEGNQRLNDFVETRPTA